MAELRQNFMTKEWVVIATERAKRPDQMAGKREAKSAVSFSEKMSIPSRPREPSDTRDPLPARRRWLESTRHTE